ncbi:nucleotide pyrophosphatase [Thermosipho sp. 1063]|uniref:alkaline phosphatase family protein n=1 Tax=Thermosipho sp. 1063 TaxID=1462747 RepID=UPI0009507006|nr:alkaline phosphatase family protein [Thermosipho sp. 1063]APT72097.1 nucleotide pyrophosphatase [Thermosipho sp. 1063]
MRKIALYFIDALPYFKKDIYDFLEELLTIKKLTPGIGYSVNQHYELVYGKQPDDIGFFGEWNISNENRSDQYKAMKYYLDNFMWKANLHFFRKVYRKIFLRIDDMVPFFRRGYFLKKGSYLFKELAANGFKLYDKKFDGYIEELDKSLPRNEKTRIKIFSSKIDELIVKSKENILVSISSVDHLGHKFGPESAKYKKLLGDLMVRVSLHIEKLLKKGYSVILFSDHGMSQYKSSVSLRNFEKIFGKYFGTKCIYFYDSLYLKVWTRDEMLEKDIVEYLENNVPGKILLKDEKHQYGISKNNYGNIILVLNEGSTFNPNYFGYKIMKGYHGYLPTYESQKGIVGISDDILEISSSKEVLTALELSKIIKVLINGVEKSEFFK